MAKIDWKTSREYTVDYIGHHFKKVPFFPMPPHSASKFDMVLTLKVGKASASDPVTIYAGLEESYITGGGLLYDEDYHRGWFQDRIDVKMSIEKHPELHRVSDGPKTQNGSGHTSSSVSFSFSGGGNVGFFGGDPTGGGSANVGASQSHSFSRDLTDFRVINRSDLHMIHHTYQMSQSSGGAYAHPSDLVPSGDDIGFIDAFRGIKLYTPPDLAVSNMPLLSQATWQATHNNAIDETLMLSLEVKQHLANVSGRNDFVTVHSHYDGMTCTYRHHEKLPLHQLMTTTGTRLA